MSAPTIVLLFVLFCVVVVMALCIFFAVPYLGDDDL